MTKFTLALTVAMIGFGLLTPVQPARAADDTVAPPMGWTTLGTAGGPVLQVERSQPSNLLTTVGKQWLVDCGEGTLQRLAGAGLQPARIGAVFVSHLHQDHVGGLAALIGLRWMQSAPGVLTVYGPPGTDSVVAGIVQSLQPSSLIGMAVRGERAGVAPADAVRVVVLRGGSDVMVDGVRVRALQNSHFDDEPGHPADNGTQSLSYRFDVPGYGIGYTGDTGPSEPLGAFFRGVDLLVSEVIDLPRIIDNINSPNSPMPPQVRSALIEHIKTQHLTAQQAGTVAAAASAHRLVLTHLAIIGPTDRSAPVLLSGAKESFGGSVTVARDLDKF